MQSLQNKQVEETKKSEQKQKESPSSGLGGEGALKDGGVEQLHRDHKDRLAGHLMMMMMMMVITKTDLLATWAFQCFNLSFA